MGMFNSMRKPRGFNHQYIYVDERKEKLAKMKRTLNATWGCCRRKNLIRKISVVSLSKELPT